MTVCRLQHPDSPAPCRVQPMHLQPMQSAFAASCRRAVADRSRAPLAAISFPWVVRLMAWNPAQANPPLAGVNQTTNVDFTLTLTGTDAVVGAQPLHLLSHLLEGRSYHPKAVPSSCPLPYTGLRFLVLLAPVANLVL